MAVESGLFFVDTDYAVTLADLMEFYMDFEACGLTVLSSTCDQGMRLFKLIYSKLDKCNCLCA